MQYKVISGDSHITEPADLWEKYIEPRYRARAPHIERKENTDAWVCDGAKLFDVGMVHGARFQGGIPDEIKFQGRWDDIPNSGWDPDARLKEQAVDGVDAEVVYATLSMRMYQIEDVEFLKALFTAYNTWLADFCKPHPHRIKGLGMISFEDMEWAVSELHRVKNLGLDGAMVPLFPEGMVPYSDRYYDPFWAAAEQLRMPISLHTLSERRPKFVTVPNGPADSILNQFNIQRTLVEMVYGCVFDRFPELQIVSAENDAGWVGYIVEKMDYGRTKGRLRHMRKENTKLLPSDYFHRNLFFTFIEDHTAMVLKDFIGVSQMMWGSDFPHIASTWPNSRRVITEHSRWLTEGERQKIFCDNTKKMYGF